jgi:hypothetical protein
MKKIMTLSLVFFTVLFASCGKSETKPKKQEVKSGLETDAPVSQEVDTLTKKMDELMENSAAK